MSSYAKIDIDGERIYSRRHEDIYFNPEAGLQESRYVFLEGNDLPERWQKKPHFSIAETGFGTGLNFLLTLHTWLNDPRRSQTLDYVSIEAFPLRAEQLAKIHASWPQFSSLSAQLIEQYPLTPCGCHALLFDQGRVQLQLIFEHAQKALRDYPLRPDSWYLDGFAPSRNPSMWNPRVLGLISEHSRPGTSLATFTAAGQVRRTLAAAGFEVRKRKGFGRKREMLCANKSTTPAPRDRIQHKPWFALPDGESQIRRVAVIGAGIAGAQTAWHLARRGIEVTLIEAGNKIAGGASGNRAGILAPRLTGTASPGEAFYLSAFGYQLNQLRSLQKEGHEIDFSPCGLLQLAKDETTAQRIEQLGRRDELSGLVDPLTPDQVSAQLGETVVSPGLLIKPAGALFPASLCRALLAEPGINIKLSTSLEEIIEHDGKPGLILSSGENIQADAVVLANGYQASDFSALGEIIPVRGQTSSAMIDHTPPPPCAVDHAAYLVSVPGAQQQVIFGASFERNDISTELRERETRANLALLSSALPRLADALSDVGSSHAGIRATTLDRWPIVGPLAIESFYRREYADLQQGKQYKSYPAGRYRAGIYILSGLGSRGLASAAYCANILSRVMTGAPPPAAQAILHALHPARFLIRKLKKGKYDE